MANESTPGNPLQGDLYFFPPDEVYVNGKLMKVRYVQTINVYGPCVFWTDGSWTKVADIKPENWLTEERVQKLWQDSLKLKELKTLASLFETSLR